ncbi:MAG: M20 family metallopeptidase [Bacteroidales bacterium]
MDIRQFILEESAKLYTQVRQHRQYLHAHPELSFEENATSSYLADRLEEMGLKVQKGWVKTGLSAEIQGKNPGAKLVVLRADMDALPIREENETAYTSVFPGTMHACGHDVHMASLLGTAMILNQLKDQFEGTVMLIFQPGEEKLPGGASLMLSEGIFRNRKPDMIIGQHVLPTLNSGCVGFRPGVYMASTDELYLTVRGKGGHGAMPQDLTDPVPVAARIILALQEITSRKAGPGRPTVLSIGKVSANGATNIVPDEVYMEGTFRTLDEVWRREAHQLIRQIAESTASSTGATCECTIREGYPVLVNNPEATIFAETAARDLLGNEAVVPQDLRMTAEDFAYFTQQYPAVFYRLGVKNSHSHSVKALHTSTFDIDETALQTGMATMAWIAWKFISKD